MSLGRSRSNLTVLSTNHIQFLVYRREANDVRKRGGAGYDHDIELFYLRDGEMCAVSCPWH